MSLYYFKPFIDILFHVFVVDQVLFELLSEFACQVLDIIYLLSDLLSNFKNLFINITTEEMSSLS